MALTKVKTVDRIVVRPPIAGDTHPTVDVCYVITLDDPDDNELPIVSNKNITLSKYTYTQTDGDDITELTDISEEDSMVQTICNAVWAD
jgi:hypothetical protein